MDDIKELNDRIQHIHSECIKIMRESIGLVLPVAGNVGVFCQSLEEYDKFSRISIDLTLPSTNLRQKYFALKEPISLLGESPEPYTYTFLYIRKPAADSPEAGDIDFVMKQVEFEQLKQDVKNEKVPNAIIYERPGWDMVEIKKDGVDGVAYVSTQEMAEKVRFQF